MEIPAMRPDAGPPDAGADKHHFGGYAACRCFHPVHPPRLDYDVSDRRVSVERRTAILGIAGHCFCGAHRLCDAVAGHVISAVNNVGVE